MKKIGLLEALEGIGGSRREGSVWYPLHEVLFIFIAAVICGAIFYVKVGMFGKSLEGKLARWTKHIVRLTVLDCLDNALLTTHHGICGHDTSSHIQGIQKFWNCRDFIRFFLCYPFSKHHLVFRRKRTHNMICLVVFALDAPYGFSIYGCYCALFPMTAQPVIQTVCQRFRIYSFKYSSKSLSGILCDNSRNWRSHSSLSSPNASISVKYSPLYNSVNGPMMIISSSLWSMWPPSVRRGSFNSANAGFKLSISISLTLPLFFLGWMRSASNRGVYLDRL